jgi:hypothetical protein
MDGSSVKGTMEEVERGTSTIKKASRNWGIPLSSYISFEW